MNWIPRKVRGRGYRTEYVDNDGKVLGFIENGVALIPMKPMGAEVIGFGGTEAGLKKKVEEYVK